MNIATFLCNGGEDLVDLRRPRKSMRSGGMSFVSCLLWRILMRSVRSGQFEHSSQDSLSFWRTFNKIKDLVHSGKIVHIETSGGGEV
jgi:hypothetical protein